MKNEEIKKAEENTEETKKGKDAFASFWSKTADVSKKAAVGIQKGAINLAEQTKKSLYDQQAKKYTTVTETQFVDKTFKMPELIIVEEDCANKEFVVESDAIGWIEKHRGVDVLHMYSTFAKKSGIVFIPLIQRGNVYSMDNFDANRFVNSNQIFGKATEEKLAELSTIAYLLGAKRCSVEIVESDTDIDSRGGKVKIANFGNIGGANEGKTSKRQSGKTISQFEGHDNPQYPNLKWFAYDDNIKGMIEMRMKKAIKANILELSGSTSATISQTAACAIDDILGIKGSMSMEKQSMKEHSSKLIYEIEF